MVVRRDFLIKNMLRSVFLGYFCLLFLSLHWACASEPSHKQILSHLSQPDREILENFFRVMLTSSEGGYVLYGSKPICFESIPNGNYDLLGSMGHHMWTLLSLGISTWEKVGLPKASEKYILHLYHPEGASESSSHFLLINRSAYDQVVNQNIALFKYVLGPQVTSEALLEQLTNPSVDFFTVLKNDKVLVGILLGFGTNNALFVNRYELLHEPSDEQSQNNLAASFGYSSLEQEVADLGQKIVPSSYRLEKYFPRLYFGHVSNDGSHSNNNTELISDYENVQKQLQKILKSEFILETVLDRFYG